MQLCLLLFIHIHWIWKNVHARTNIPAIWNKNVIIRGGELESYNDFENDYDEYDNEDLPPPRNPNHNRRRGNSSRPRRNIHRSSRRPPKPNAAVSAVNFAVNAAKKTADVATNTAVTSIKGSTRAAVHLASPKFVSRREIVGVWRFDQQVGDLPNGPFTSCAANIEFTPKGETITTYNEKQMISTFMFSERKWPRSCLIEFEANAFQGPTDKEPINMLYKGHFRRKIANRSIIKIEGKIYSVSGGGRLWSRRREILVGTFTARKRIVKREIENVEDDYEEYDGYFDEGYDSDDDYDEEDYDEYDEEL